MSRYEEYIAKILLKDNYSFVREKTFKDLKNNRFRYDFYVKNKILIEVDGEYHFKAIRGRRELLKQKEHDRIKNSYALAHNIKLYRIPYWEIYNIKKVNDILVDKFLVKDKWHNDKLIVQK